VLRSGLVLIVCQGRMSAADAVRRVTVSSLHTVSSLKCSENAQKGTVGASNMRTGHKAGETGTQLVVVCDTAALTAPASLQQNNEEKVMKSCLKHGGT